MVAAVPYQVWGEVRMGVETNNERFSSAELIPGADPYIAMLVAQHQLQSRQLTSDDDSVELDA